MVIAVNTRFLLDELEGYGYFIHELFRLIIRNHPEHQFYFLFDRPYDQKYIYADNVIGLVVSPPARHPILWKYWYDVKVPLTLRRIKADVFVSTDGFCSLSTRTPQCVVVHDLGFLHHPEAYKASHLRYYKSYTPKFIRKAETLVTVSGVSKEDIIRQYRTNAARVSIVYNGVRKIFRPVSAEQKDLVKEKYTEGKEYFLCVGAIQPRKNLVNLLKAFSIFKKRLQSNMKLVISGRVAWKSEEFLQLMKAYKYKAEVVLTGYLPEKELALVMASAYALVYPSVFEGFGVPVVEAMKSRVPVLTSENTAMQEAGGDAALYFDPADHSDIADKMMTIYKDENLRFQMIEKGCKAAEKFSWEQSAEQLWTIIEKTAAKQRNS
jgi:glycosyltransferase involved in cell wall biosynthesis